MISTDCLSEKEQYKDHGKMKRLLRCRQDEMDAVYHQKDLVDIFLTMSRKLEEFITGIWVRTVTKLYIVKFLIIIYYLYFYSLL